MSKILLDGLYDPDSPLSMLRGVRGEEVVRDVLGALGAEALGVGGVGVGASVGCALLDPPSVPCPECEHVECRCVVPRVWSRGGWRERDEFDDLD